MQAVKTSNSMKIRLIEFYRDNDFLWNPDHDMYREHFLSAEAWDSCAKQFKMPGLKGQTCKKLVVSLRSYYKKLRVIKNKNNIVPLPVWFPLMDSFLGPVLFDENNDPITHRKWLKFFLPDADEVENELEESQEKPIIANSDSRSDPKEEDEVVCKATVTDEITEPLVCETNENKHLAKKLASTEAQKSNVQSDQSCVSSPIEGTEQPKIPPELNETAVTDVEIIDKDLDPTPVLSSYEFIKQSQKLKPSKHNRKDVIKEISLLLTMYDAKKHLPNPTAKSQPPALFNEAVFTKKFDAIIAENRKIKFDKLDISKGANKKDVRDEIARRLMLLYKQHSILWDPYHARYAHTFFRNKAWDNITECINIDGFDNDEFKKRVHQLRSRYVMKRKNFTDEELAECCEELEWFKLIHSFLGTVLFEKNEDGKTVLVNVRQGQQKWRERNLSKQLDPTKSPAQVFIVEDLEDEPDTCKDDLIINFWKCRACLNDSVSAEQSEPNNIHAAKIDGIAYLQLYNEIIGYESIGSETLLPEQLCTSCETSLLDFYKFRKKCRENELSFVASLKETSEIKGPPETVRISPDLPKEKATTDEAIENVLAMLESDAKEDVTIYEDMEVEYLEEDTSTKSDDQSPQTQTEHLPMIHRINVEEEVVQEPQPKKRKQNICPECGKTVTYLASHMKTHLQTLDHICTLCKKSYKTKRALVMHSRSFHEGLTLKCAFCPLEFRSWSGRQDHYLLKHFNNSSSFQCSFPTCNRSFPTSRILKRHIRQIHSQQKYKCDQCEVMFSRKQTLKEHKDSKHSDSDSVVCEVCNKKFSNKKLLRQHCVGVHSGEKNYKCLCCEKAFTQNHVMRLHMKKLHPESCMQKLPPKGTIVNAKALQRIERQKAIEKAFVKVDVECLK